MYLRQTTRIVNDIPVTTPLSKSRLYGIAKEKYVAQTENYDNSYVTEFDSTVLKHATENLYALEMTDTNGLPDIFLNDLEDVLPDGWMEEVIEEGE